MIRKRDLFEIIFGVATKKGRLFDIMLIGYSIIAVPTGIVTYEMTKSPARPHPVHCPGCSHENPGGSVFCNSCGKKLNHKL